MIYLLSNLENQKKLVTKRISIPILASSIKEKLDSTKQAIKRLKRKQYIETVSSLGSYGGYSVIKINQIAYKILKKESLYNSSNIITTIRPKVREGVKTAVRGLGEGIKGDK